MNVHITQKGCNIRYIVAYHSLKVQHCLQQGCNTHYIVVYQWVTEPNQSVFRPEWAK